ncbi:MAG: hypothetical protein U0946_05560, partial [Patescibacteria group bacterium]|nr:hypothetical protein [Patescibacteria group bacterium]
LLSANEAQKRGLMPVSGEITQFPKGGIFLTNVYATSEGITSGNNTSAFFDQETVSFVINEVQQEVTMRQELVAANIPATRHDEIINRKLRRLPSFQPLDSDYLMSLPVEDRQKVIKEKLKQARTSDQLLSSKSYESFLGSRVPLKNISAIAVPFDLLNQAGNLFGWTTKLLVREAAELVNNKTLQVLEPSSLKFGITF